MALTNFFKKSLV